MGIVLQSKNSLLRSRTCRVVGTSAFDGSGVEDAMIELRNAIKKTDELGHRI